MENNLASIFITHLDDINDAGFKFFTYLYECKKTYAHAGKLIR